MQRMREARAGRILLKRCLSNYIIRNLRREEMSSFAVPLMISEGWNPGILDGDAFFSADPEGFHVGLLNNEPIGCISGVKYDNKFAFAGLYIVKEEHRGKSYGMQLTQHMLNRLDGYNIGGDAVLENVSIYERIGWKPSYKNIRFEGFRPAMIKYKISKHDEGLIRNANEVDFNLLKSLDLECYPAERDIFLKNWITQPDSYSYALLDNSSLKNCKVVLAYGTIRRCFRGWKIGPLFARDKISANIILSKLLENLDEGEIFILDVPEPNQAALEIANEYNMKQSFVTARMYSKETPKINLKQIYGITSFELG